MKKLHFAVKANPNLLAMAFLFFLQGVMLWRLILFGQFSPDWDLIGQIFPWKVISMEMVKNGIMPLWNPYIFSGTPLSADMLSGVFYPLNLFFLLLPPFIALKLFYLFHFFLAGLFTYHYCLTIKIDRFSALIASSIFPVGLFVFSGQTLSTNPTVLGSIIWLPLLFHLVELLLANARLKNSLLIGLVIALQFLAGHPQIAYYSTLTLSLYLLARTYQQWTGRQFLIRILWLFFLSLIIGAGISSVQILPTAELTNFSYRGWKQEGLGGIGIGSFFRPTVIYMGILPLVLSLAGIVFSKNGHKLFFGFLTIASLLTMSEFTHLSILLAKIIPFFKTFYGVDRLAYLYIFSLSVLAAIGANALLKDADTHKKAYLVRVSKISIALFFFLGFLSISGCLGKEVFFSYLDKAVSTGSANSEIAGKLIYLYNSFNYVLVFSTGVLFAVFGVVSLRQTSRIGNDLFKLLLLALVLVTLLSQEKGQYVNLGDYFKKTKAAEFLNQRAGYERIAAMDPVFDPERPHMNFFVPNVNSIHNLYGVQGYSPLHLASYRGYMDFIGGVKKGSANQPLGEKERFFVLKNINSKLIDLLNVRYIVTAYDEINDPGYKLVFNEDVKIYENSKALGRAFMVFNYKVVKDSEECFKELKSEIFDPRETVILETEPLSTPEKKKKLLPVSGKAKITSYLPNEVTIRTASERDGFLILADSYYPGWKVYVDGKEDVIYRANRILRAVHLDGGNHTVKFVYEPFSFKLGAGISLFTLFCVLICFLMQSRKKKR